MTADLDKTISAATRALLDCQRPDGEWCFELEADCTIPAEYVLLRHYLGEPVDAELERKIAVYLRRTQSDKHGGWPGAFLAQRRFRHKTRKLPYQFVFIVIVLLYQLVAVDEILGHLPSRQLVKWVAEVAGVK